MATATQFLQAELEEFGRNPKGGSKYFKYFSGATSDQPHCCEGQSYMLTIEQGRIIHGSNTVSLRAAILADGGEIIANKWTDNAQPGDILLMHWDNSTALHSTLDHACVYELDKGNGVIQTLDFNGNKARENRRFLRYKSNVAYVIRPNWTKKDTAAWFYDKTSGKWYHYTNGALDRYTWVKSNDKWYYIGSGGFAVSNEWHEANGNWYYLGENGYPVTNQWIEHKNQWYWCGKDGLPVTGWQKVDGKWYHFDEDCVCEYDTLAEHNGAWYWLGEDGAVVVDQDISLVFHAGSDGKLSIG